MRRGDGSRVRESGPPLVVARPREEREYHGSYSLTGTEGGEEKGDSVETFPFILGWAGKV